MRTVLPGLKPLPLAVVREPGGALISLKEALGTAAAPAERAVAVVLVAVVEGPATKNSSARPVKAAK
jgi:hypothetical protein